MQITLNGQTREFEQLNTVQELLNELSPGQSRIAVEINGEIIPRSQFSSHTLQAGDRVEVIQAVGGG